MRTNWLRILLVLGLVSTAAWAQLPRRQRPTNNNTLSLWVKLASGAELTSLVRVELFLGDMPLEEVYLDSRAQQTFNSLDDGTYAIRVSAPGFQSEYQTVLLSGGISRRLIVLLKAGSDKEVKEDVSNLERIVDARWLAAPESARNDVLKAKELRLSKDYKGAVKHLHQALKTHPNFVYAHNELGMCYRGQAKTEEARKSFEEAIKADPDFLYSYLNLAEMLAEIKQYNEAGSVLLHASRGQPRAAEPYFAMAKIQFQTGHLDRAEQACKMALARDSSRIPEVHMVLVNIYLRRGDTAKVEEELKTYLSKAPQGELAESARTALQKIQQETVRKAH